MNWLWLGLSFGGMVAAYFLGRDHGYNEVAGQLNVMEEALSKAEFERDVARMFLMDKVQKNAKLRRALLAYKLQAMRDRN